MSDSTYVRTPDVSGRASTGRIVGYLDYRGGFEATDRSNGAGEPKGTIDHNNVIHSAGVARKQVGYLTGGGEVYRGHEYSNSKTLEATVTVSKLLNAQGDVVLLADGPESARALAAAWLLVHSDQDRTAYPVLKALGVAAAAYAADKFTDVPAASESLPPLSDLPGTAAARRAQCNERSELEAVLRRQNQFAIGREPQEYLPRHAKSQFFFKWKIGDLVDVTMPLAWRGVGEIIAVSTDFEYGLGTKLYPRVLVEYWDGSQEWHNGISLTKLRKAEYEAAVSRDPRRSRPRPDFDHPPPPPQYPSPENIIGFAFTSPFAAFAAASFSGGKAVTINATTDEGLTKGLATMPRAGEGNRAIPIVGALDATGFKSAMSGLVGAINDGVDVCRVVLLHPDPFLLREQIGIDVLDYPLDQFSPPKVEHLSPAGWVRRTEGWLKFKAPDLAAMPVELRTDPHDAAQAFCAALPLITSDYARPRAFGVGGDRALFDALAPLLTRYTLVAYVSEDGADAEDATPYEAPVAERSESAEEALESELVDETPAEGEPDLPDFAEFLAAGSAEAAATSVREDLLPLAFQDPAAHGIGLVRAWRAEESPLSAEFKESGSISRGDLFDFAERARERPGSWTQLLVNTFGWGWGGTSLGPSRLARVLEATEAQIVEDNLAKAVATLDSDGAVAAYWDLNNSSRYYLKHLGPAFFTKFLYFAAAGGPRLAPRPLILDKIVAVRVNGLLGRAGRLATGGWSTRDYAFYLALMDRLAARLNERDGNDLWTTDAVELGIFKPPAVAHEDVK